MGNHVEHLPMVADLGASAPYLPLLAIEKASFESVLRCLVAQQRREKLSEQRHSAWRKDKSQSSKRIGRAVKMTC